MKISLSRPLARRVRSLAARRALVLGLTVAAALGGCALRSFTHPPAVEGKTIEIEPLNGAGPAAGVDVVLDDRGIPHIFGESESDIAYGLGFMHGRDRTFQIELMRHAAQGRLTELFGEAMLDTDRELRLLTYRLDEAVEALEGRDRAIAEAYVAGVNRGAEHAGTPLEMRILGRDFAPYTVRDLMSLIRLQAWQLGFDFEEELIKERIMSRLPEGDPRRQAFLVALDTGGVSIISPAGEGEGVAAPVETPIPDTPGGTLPDKPTGDDGVPLEPIPLEPLPLEPLPLEGIPAGPAPEGEPAPAQEGSADGGPGAVDKGAALGPRVEDPTATLVRANLGLDRKGASNSWVVSGKHTADGRPVLCNDPHLRHGAPATMYLAHLEHPEWTIAGATLPGLPAVVIGRTRHLAWGLTTSFVDAQDLARISRDPERKDRFMLDGKSHAFLNWEQEFKVGGTVHHTETWRITPFGPVLPSVFDDRTDPGAEYALQWVTFDPATTAQTITGLWGLGSASNVKEARATLEKVGAPSQNIVLAFDSGDIAYHLMGAIPRRRSAAPIDRPRDGRSSEAGWTGYLESAEKPSLENPAAGYIVTANQRIVADDDTAVRLVGNKGTTPHRAQRIHQRLRALIAGGKKASADDILSVQQDIESPEAVRLAPVFAARCPSSIEGHPPERVKAFCDALSTFDGRYALESKGATVFTAFVDEFQRAVIVTHLGDDVYKQIRTEQSVIMAIENAALGEHAGEPSLLFDDMRTKDREGLDGFARKAAKAALDRVVEEAGRGPEDWAWGDVHTLAFKGPLARAPVVGALFETEALPEPGWHRTPRAEGGVPVRWGAVFRMVAQMGETSDVRMTIDLGQSGHFGHPHFDDQREAWRTGKPRAMPLQKDAIAAEGSFRLAPVAAAKVASGN